MNARRSRGPDAAATARLDASGGLLYVHDASWLAIYPGLALLLLVLGNPLGDGISSLLDPRLRLVEVKPL